MTATESLDVRAALRAAYNAAPVEDHDRVDRVGREVLAEVPAPWPVEYGPAEELIPS